MAQIGTIEFWEAYKDGWHEVPVYDTETDVSNSASEIYTGTEWGFVNLRSPDSSDNIELYDGTSWFSVENSSINDAPWIWDGRDLSSVYWYDGSTEISTNIDSISESDIYPAPDQNIDPTGAFGVVYDSDPYKLGWVSPPEGLIGVVSDTEITSPDAVKICPEGVFFADNESGDTNIFFINRFDATDTWSKTFTNTTSRAIAVATEDAGNDAGVTNDTRNVWIIDETDLVLLDHSDGSELLRKSSVVDSADTYRFAASMPAGGSTEVVFAGSDYISAFNSDDGTISWSISGSDIPLDMNSFTVGRNAVYGIEPNTAATIHKFDETGITTSDTGKELRDDEISIVGPEPTIALQTEDNGAEVSFYDSSLTELGTSKTDVLLTTTYPTYGAYPSYW